MASKQVFHNPYDVMWGTNNITSVTAIGITIDPKLHEQIFTDGEYYPTTTVSHGESVAVAITLYDFEQAMNLVNNTACTVKDLTFKVKNSCGNSDKQITISNVGGWKFNGEVTFSNGSTSEFVVTAFANSPDGVTSPISISDVSSGS